MLPAFRARFNREFSQERYNRFVSEMATRAGVPIEFTMSETPCFFSRALMDELVTASQAMIASLLGNPAYLAAAEREVPDAFRLANGEALPTFLQVDFGLVRTNSGVEGRLVELQAFPSLYGFQLALAETSRDIYGFGDLDIALGGLDRESYVRVMRDVLLGGHDSENVVLMEIDPARQKTRPDFEITRQLWGIAVVDTADVIRDGRRLLYRRNGRLTEISRVYNRVIPDELMRKKIQLSFDYRDDIDVEWTGGPDWYFRVSKLSIPWLTHPWVPRTQFLSDVSAMPEDRENWLLKPLYSFAGAGIIFAPTDAQIASIPDADRRHYILQERVAFTPVIDTPHGPTQAELRIMFIRHNDTYRAVMPLVRMGRGKMMGVDHNRGLQWVGAAAALMGTG